MKKLTIILLFAYMHIFCAYSQTLWGVDYTEKDKQDHAYFGYVTGFVVNWSAYEILEDTKIKPVWAKLISFGIGIVAGVTLGHLKEKWDLKHGKVYSIKDLKATTTGGVAGSGTLSLVFFIFLPNKDLPPGTIIYESIEDIPNYSLDNPIFNMNN